MKKSDRELLLRAKFESAVRSSWGWTILERDGESYVATIVATAWKAFKYGYELGKAEKETQNEEDHS